MTIKELMIESNQTAREKGFWGGELNKIEHRNNSELLMLMVSELGEACEALRHNNPPSEHIPEFSAIEEELADLLIRACDMAEMRGYRLEEALEAKLLFNKSRPYKHNKEF